MLPQRKAECIIKQSRCQNTPYLARTDCDRQLCAYVVYRIYKAHLGVLETQPVPLVGMTLKRGKDGFLSGMRFSCIRGKRPYSQTPPSLLDTVVDERSETPESGV